MDFKTFCDDIEKNILEYLPEQYQKAEVMIKPVLKNNSLVLHGLTIRNPDEKIVPTMYMEHYYEKYQAGQEIENLMENIAVDYLEHCNPQIDYQVEHIMELDNVKDKIMPIILNAKHNKDMAKIRPSTRIDDLAVFYQIVLERSEFSTASVAVSNDMMEKWGISTEELHHISIENNEKYNPVLLTDIESVLFGTPENYLEIEDKTPNSPLLVLSNQTKSYGASVIANPAVLEKVADAVGGDYYVLPSSVHEVLICPKEIVKEMGMTPKELGKMVREVNQQEVSRDEVLSDHVYSYDRENKVLETVKESKQRNMDMER